MSEVKRRYGNAGGLLEPAIAAPARTGTVLDYTKSCLRWGWNTGYFDAIKESSRIKASCMIGGARPGDVIKVSSKDGRYYEFLVCDVAFEEDPRDMWHGILEPIIGGGA